MKLAQFNQNGELVATCDFECQEAPHPYVSVEGIDYPFNAIKDGVPLWIEPPFDLAVYKANKQRELNRWHEAMATSMKAKYTSAEIEAFVDKRKEALAWKTDNTSPTPYISAMVGGVEEARVALLNAILAKIDAAAQAEMYVLTTRDVINACTTKEEIDAVEFPNV
jgi:hypothetical protein